MQPCNHCKPGLEYILDSLSRNKSTMYFYDHKNDQILADYNKKAEKGYIDRESEPYKSNEKRLEEKLNTGTEYALRIDTKNGNIHKVSVFDYEQGKWFNYSSNEFKNLINPLKEIYGKDNKKLDENIKKELSNDPKIKNPKLINIGYKGNNLYGFYPIENKEDYSIKDNKSKEMEVLGKDKNQIKESIYDAQKEKIEKELPKETKPKSNIEYLPSKAVKIDSKDSIAYSYANSGLVVVEIEQKVENKFRFAQLKESLRNDLNTKIFDSYKKKREKEQLEYKRKQELLAA